MQKECKCKNIMSVQLRTVKYSKKIKIKNVPIYSCEECKASEILLDVKEELTELIKKIGHSISEEVIYFNDMNEFAHLLYVSSDHESLDVPIDNIIEQRVNELLDMLLLAQSLNDSKWVQETEKRLLQISNKIIHNEEIYKI
ncbi:hypothetical protein [Chengkuizengella axinellae]|uniref:YgiT-type zinc finger protein n=1 Tax=Chengkuizengella axinellae TaxID=3064388 RepID=A0ABT9IVF3_9BACL|nr:hypothetical protein [Chengkuizengella sp. 2205SS18-9]MDP5273318.1 hypothetical protein [Chengkuizengella sp. 2205SS18-9]